MNVKRLNELLGITESYQMSEKLLEILLESEKRDEIFHALKWFYDFGHDDFRDYYPTEHGDRTTLKQDYTPDCLCSLIAALLPDNKDSLSLLDACSGTGALTLPLVKRFGEVTCEELSSRAIPVLLCNLALRNGNADVLRKDIISNDVFECWRVAKGDEFSEVIKVDDIAAKKYDVIVSNPP